MQRAVTFIDGYEPVTCKFCGNGELCYYHGKVFDRLMQPSPEVERIQTEDGATIYGTDEKRYWRALPFSRGKSFA